MATAAMMTTEGLSMLKSILLQPLVPASCLAFVSYAPKEMVERVFNPEMLEKFLRITDIRTPLRILLALGVIRTVNRFLNQAALSNWTLSSPSKWNMDSELAVVTGGCSGIGKAITLGLADKGVQVAILDVQDLPPDMAKNNLIRLWKCDVTSADSVREAADDIRLNLGHPTILINNAGIAHSMTILDTSTEYLNKIVGVNMLSLWYATKEFMPNMILKNKGHIVTVASAASFVSLCSAAHYSATKAGALAFTECLRSEIKFFHKSPGVLASVVHPMWVQSNMTDKYADTITSAMGPMMGPTKISDPIISHIARGRAGQISVPDHTKSLSSLRCLPNWFQELLRDLPSAAVSAGYKRPGKAF